MFSLSNKDRMGPEYWSIMGKPQDPDSSPCDNTGEDNTFPLRGAGTPALNYLAEGHEQKESTGYCHYPKYGSDSAYYTTGDYVKYSTKGRQ